jgi:predicted transcriptional regulator
MPKPLTDAEHRVMNVVWDLAEATVASVHESLAAEGLAYSTVLTTMRILEEKGWLTHTKEGRAFVYRPVTPREEAGRHAVRDLLGKFFGNRADLLVMNLLEDEKLSRRELDRLKKLIAKED